MERENFYRRLEISEKATQEEIQAAFRSAARKLHPDVNLQPGATEHFLEIKEAYEVLVDPQKRSVYDDRNVFSRKAPPPPIRVTPYHSRTKLSWLTEAQIHYTLLDMEVLTDQFPSEAKTVRPTNITLVLDCSTSMQGDRLEKVKGSAIEIMRQLRSQDHLSIVSFNDRAEVVLPAATYANNIKSEGRVRLMQAQGGTEIFQGLAKGFLEVRKNLDLQTVNHIILITDGHTYGDEGKCHKLAQEAANAGIGISCLGIGHEWNDEFLESLAAITGGSCFYVKKPKDIRSLLKKKIAGLGQVHAENIKLSLQTSSNVELTFAYRLQPEAGELPIENNINLGNIPKGFRQRVLLEFLVPPIPPSVQQVLIAEANLIFTLPSISNTTYRIPITIVRPVQANTDPEPPPPIIVEAMSRLTLFRMQEQVQKELNCGNYHEATTRLQNMATRLLARGEADLAKTVLNEVKHINQEKQFSQDGDKAIKYGTKALLLPSG
jgi:Ca-activated chloride channel homolog